jgi:hypothetical protein
MIREVVISESKALAVATRDGILVPRVIAAAGGKAARRFLEFFAATTAHDDLCRLSTVSTQAEARLSMVAYDFVVPFRTSRL